MRWPPQLGLTGTARRVFNNMRVLRSRDGQNIFAKNVILSKYAVSLSCSNFTNIFNEGVSGWTSQLLPQNERDTENFSDERQTFQLNSVSQKGLKGFVFIQM